MFYSFQMFRWSTPSLISEVVLRNSSWPLQEVNYWSVNTIWPLQEVSCWPLTCARGQLLFRKHYFTDEGVDRRNVRNEYSHFSLVRTTLGKEKFFTIENYLSVRIFQKKKKKTLDSTCVTLYSHFGQKFFTIENYLLVRIFCVTLGFTVSTESSVWFGQKSIITLFFKFNHWFKICLTRIGQ